jgi:hypothetical protein
MASATRVGRPSAGWAPAGSGISSSLAGLPEPRASLEPKAGYLRRESAGGAVFLWVQHLGKAGVFLKEGEVFVVAGVIAILRPELDGHL